MAKECMAATPPRGCPQDCDGLDRYEQELLAQMKGREEQWGVQRVLDVAKRGGQFVLQVMNKAGDVLRVVLESVLQLGLYLLPMLTKAIMMVIYSPKAVLMALIFVKHLKHKLCSTVSHWLLLRNVDVPPKTTLLTVTESTGRMLEVGKDVIKNVGAAEMTQVIGNTLQNVFKNSSVSFGTIVTASVSLVPGVGPVLGPLAGGLISGAMETTGGVLKEAAEVAAHQELVGNAFGQFLETIDISDCANIFREKYNIRQEAKQTQQALLATPRHHRYVLRSQRRQQQTRRKGKP